MVCVLSVEAVAVEEEAECAIAGADRVCRDKALDADKLPLCVTKALIEVELLVPVVKGAACVVGSAIKAGHELLGPNGPYVCKGFDNIWVLAHFVNVRCVANAGVLEEATVVGFELEERWVGGPVGNVKGAFRCFVMRAKKAAASALTSAHSSGDKTPGRIHTPCSAKIPGTSSGACA